MKLPVLIFVLLSVLMTVQCYKLLIVFPMASKSHFILGTSLAKGLAKAGHDITVVTPYEDKNVPSGKYRHIAVTEIDEVFKSKNLDMFNGTSMVKFFTSFKAIMEESARAVLTHPEIRKLIKNKETFDAVIIEEFQMDSLKVLPFLFNAHAISFCSAGANAWVNKLVGNPAPLSYIPDVMTGFPAKMTFFQRVINVFAHYMGEVMGEYIMGPPQRNLLKELYPGAPQFDKLKYNVSLLLLNANIATVAPVPYVPNMISIGGYHVQPPKPLPKDLKEFLDNAKEGVVYFSMGSVLNTTNIPQEKRDVLINTFKQLKQKVLWKFNEDLPGKSANVKIEKWLPQQSILAHPNVKLFITHGGLLSTTETIYHGKPVLAIPIFADQPTNAKQMQNNGFGLIQDFDDLVKNPNGFLEKIQELLNNPQYFNNAQRRSKIFHDQPMKPIDTANFWIEYVIRHNGAPHLRVVGAELPWYKLYLVDVWAFLIVSTLLFAKIIKIVVKKLVCRKKQQKKLKQG